MEIWQLISSHMRNIWLVELGYAFQCEDLKNTNTFIIVNASQSNSIGNHWVVLAKRYA